jgi:predicted enzyme related to lactoylglutathione lyase
MQELKLSSFVLFVNNINTSKEFYEKVLGQEIALEINNINIGFKSGLALWDKEYATKLIFDKGLKDISENNNLEIYFETNTIDRMYKKVQELSIKIIHEINTQPWQQRVFRFYDPDNFIIEVAETMEEVIRRLNKENLTIEAIADKTFMPKEIIQAILNK